MVLGGGPLLGGSLATTTFSPLAYLAAHNSNDAPTKLHKKTSQYTCLFPAQPLRFYDLKAGWEKVAAVLTF